MNSHINVERLSAYLDEELDQRDATALESHLKQCADCRRHLAGLRRVVRGLRTLERVAPPSVLDQAVQRRLALDTAPQGLAERLESRRGRVQRLDATVFISFAVVLALAAIVYLFAQALEREGTQVPIIVPAASSLDAEPGEGMLLEVEERDFVRRGREWHELGVEVGAARAVALDSAEGERLRAAMPWLGPLVADAAAVVVRVDDEAIRIERPAATPSR